MNFEKQNIEFIKIIESSNINLDVKVKGIHVWPLIRLYFHKFSNLKPSVVRPKKLEILKKIKFCLKSLFYFHEIIYTIFKRSDILMLTNTTYLRNKFNDKWVDIYMHPLVTRLEMQGKTSKILELSRNYEFKRPVLKKHSHITLFSRFFYVIFEPVLSILNKKDITKNQELNDFLHQINTIVSENNISIKKISTDNILPIINKIYTLSKFYRFLLRRSKAKKAVLIGYTTADGLAFCNASSELKIDSIELQHGVISNTRPRHFPYKKVPSGGFNILPKFFWLWNEADVLKYGWANEPAKHYALPFSNIWIIERKKYFNNGFFKKKSSDKEINILVNLQLISVTPNMLYDAINNSPPNCKWLIRFHPADKEKDKFLSLFRMNVNDMTKLDLDLPNDVNLSNIQLIDYADCLVTSYSTSAIEAAALRKPVFLIHQIGCEYYQDYIKNKQMKFTPTESDLLNALKKYKKPQNSINTEINDQIEDINKSYEVIFNDEKI